MADAEIRSDSADIRIRLRINPGIRIRLRINPGIRIRLRINPGIRIRLRINPEIRIRIPDYFLLRLDALAEVCALWAQSSLTNAMWVYEHEYNSNITTAYQQILTPNSTEQRTHISTVISLLPPPECHVR